MWKKVGNVRAGDTSSIRSNQSREDEFEYYYKHHSSVDEKRTPFCQDYFARKRESDSIGDALSNSRTHSQLSNPRQQSSEKPQQLSPSPNNNDLFSHIRTVFTFAPNRPSEPEPSLMDPKPSRMNSTIKAAPKHPLKLKQKLSEARKKLASLHSEQ